MPASGALVSSRNAPTRTLSPETATEHPKKCRGYGGKCSKTAAGAVGVGVARSKTYTLPTSKMESSGALTTTVGPDAEIATAWPKLSAVLGNGFVRTVTGTVGVEEESLYT